MQLSAVDLPQPDGPSRAMNSPREMVKREIAKRVDRAEIAAHALEAKLFEGTPAISRTAEA